MAKTTQRTTKGAPTAKKKARYSHREDDPRVKGGPELYGSTRARLRKERGWPGEHTCKCGQPATAWVFTPRKGAEVWVDPGSLRFSREPEHYTAMCGPCRGKRQKKTARK